jgi:hypothetical protein
MDANISRIWFHTAQYYFPFGMPQLIERTLLWLRGETLRLLLLAGGLLLIWGTVSPVGTLVWWLNQNTESLGLKKNQLKRSSSGSSAIASTQPKPNSESEIDCYIVFLPGVGDFSADQLTSGEEFFLNRLIKLHPNCVAVADVFPYSVANESLGDKRWSAPLWRAVEEASGWLENADALIKIRNLWRFAISADDRYGVIYNRGIAIAIRDRMNAAHPIPQLRRPLNLILIGTSGGAQVALGAVPYLNQWLDARLTVVSVGGVFDGETGFDQANHVYHLKGEQDWIENISRIVFPACWRWTVASPFNRARQQGRYTVQDSGPQAHDGDKGYFGEAIAVDQTTYVELTLQKVNQLPIWSIQK